MESEKIVISAQIENEILEKKIRDLKTQIKTNKKLIEKYCKHKYINNKCMYCNNYITADAIHNQYHKPRKNNQTVS